MVVKGEAAYKSRLKGLAALPLVPSKDVSVDVYPKITFDINELQSNAEDAGRWYSLLGITMEELKIQRRENFLHDIYRAPRPWVLASSAASFAQFVYAVNYGTQQQSSKRGPAELPAGTERSIRYSNFSAAILHVLLHSQL
jgi:hypothetical protein